MARKVIDTGVVGNDGTGDSIRDSFRKVNENFRELYGALGLGSSLSFASLEDAPPGGVGDAYYQGFGKSLVTVNNDGSGLQFKQLAEGAGIKIDFEANTNEIQIINTRASIANYGADALGGDLNVQSGGETHRIYGMNQLPTSSDEAVSKAYADTKIARAGVNAVDPATGRINSALGTMTGPLVLSRDPRPDDDVTYGGLVAATKRYVDNAGFGSSVNLHVATSGSDARTGVGSALQGRALSYAYRTLEAALKRAEEIIKGARPEIGPYKKVLTYTNPITLATTDCTLTSIEVAPGDGTGFSGRVRMTIDTITLTNGGFNYQVGDIIRINNVGAADIDAATIEVLTLQAEPGVANGPILTFRLLTGGLFDNAVPGSVLVDKATESEGGVSGDGVDYVIKSDNSNSSAAAFSVTYKVSNAVIDENGGGTGYSLVSVRVEGGGGTGAFGFADVSGGEIVGITITDGGSGFTDIPDLVVNLPRFAIYTSGFGTDFTGDYETDSVVAKRGRDIREGLYLRGETSGALAQILAHNGERDTEGNELFDVDIKYGVFEIGETISYGDVANSEQVVIFVESGIYYENLPLRVPANCSVVGDDFRRSIIRPKAGQSSSPWAFLKFRRDRIVDGLNTAKSDYNRELTELNAYHYLSQADQPVYPQIANKGYYRSASKLLELNKAFIQEEVIAWINKQVVDGSAPFGTTFTYNQDLCKRDVGLLIDAMAYDLRWGGSDRTVSASLKYYQAASSLGDPAIAIDPNAQLSQTLAAIRRLNAVAQSVIKNITVPPTSYTNPVTRTLVEYSEPQIIDTAYTAETGSGGLRVTIANIDKANVATVTTASAHGLDTGAIVTFTGCEGLTSLNNTSFWIQRISTTQFRIYTDYARNYGVNTNAISGEYVLNSGDMIPVDGGPDFTVSSNDAGLGGVLGLLTGVILNIIGNSSQPYNEPLDNDKMDVFLMNDATQLRRMTIQGHGGFAMVLDPEGQILAKSPYAQEGAVFSKSTGKQTFAGGMYVDGFTGNLQFRILEKISNTRLKVGELVRFPQLPASFIVDDTVYRINYVRDFTFGATGSTATFVLDDTTPWPFPVFEYNEAICNRDVGLIINGLSNDILFGSNYWSRKAALTYRQANAHVVIADQLDLTSNAIDYAHDRADAVLAALSPSSGYSSARAVVAQSKTVMRNIIRRGATATPALTLPSPPSLPAKYGNAKTLLLNNINFIRDEVIAYLEDQYPYYDREKCYRDVGLILEAVLNDLVFSTNYYSRTAGLAYLRNLASSAYVLSDQKTQTIAGINKARDLANAYISDSGIRALITANFAIVTNIINTGAGAAPSLSYTVPSIDSGISNAAAQIRANVAFIKAEITAWIAVQVAGNTSPFSSSYTYDSAKCERDIGYLIDAMQFDLLYGGNTATVDAANSYFYGTTVISGQVNQTIAAYVRLQAIIQQIAQEAAVSKSVGNAATQDTSGTPGSAAAALILSGLVSDINTIIAGNGVTKVAPTYSLGTPSYATARTTIIAQKATIQTATVDWLEANDYTFTYDRIKCQRDVEYIVESLAYDITYGGNSQSWDAAQKYYDGVGSVYELQIPSTQSNETIGAIEHLQSIVSDIVRDIAVTPSPGNTTTQARDSVNKSDLATAGELENLVQIIIDTLTIGSSNLDGAVITYPDPTDYAYDTYSVGARTALVGVDGTAGAKSTIQTEVITFVNNNANLFEVLMPGNRSMLSNDFTQICDMGYGVVVTNGGLTECVSMFTYYCYTSYYSINGGQVRGVAGSSAHGVYALAAEGSDPLEVPTPVDIYYDLSQGATVYNDGGLYDNVKGGLTLYVSNYRYTPIDFSEIEVDHGGEIGLVRYPVVTAAVEDSFPFGIAGSGGSDSSQRIYRLSLSSDVATGLVAEIPDGTDVTLRQNTQIILTGNVVGVAVRPSTALKLNETFTSNLYRILNFADYTPPDTELQTCTFSTSVDTLITSPTPHGLLPTYIVKFSTNGTLPTGLNDNDKYWIVDDGFTETTFKVASTKTGSPITVTSTGSGTFFFESAGLAKTTLREGYDYIEITVYGSQPFVTYGDTLQATGGSFVAGRTYTITSHGSTTFTAIGASDNNPGTVFTATGAGSGTGTGIINACTFSTSTLNATSMVAGQGYKILTLGSTTNSQWLAAGDDVTTAAANDLFTATGAAGGGDGTVLYSKVTRNSHGLSNGDVIRFESTDALPSGVYENRHYFVINKTANTFQLGDYPGSTKPVTWTTDSGGAGSGYHGVGAVIGRVGDTNFAVVELGTNDVDRIVGTKFNFKGQDYTISSYDSPAITGQIYAKLYLTTPLVDSVTNFGSSVSLLSAVAARTEDSQGTLTIRIALTRVTGHDLLDIGTGSYADTNYPNEIYGLPVRIATETLLDTTGNVEYAQVVERGEGRCFFVTTDQFGNFSVGSYFRVDQGTGTVTFSASLALSNLAGLGFKKGVPISEFSTDTSMDGNATDAVPVENAVRSYIDRRLGITHGGTLTEDIRVIPITNGGFMALNGLLPMKANMNLGNNRITNVADPVADTDAVNKQSVKFDAIIANSFPGQSVGAGYMIAFTGAGSEGRAVEISGDLVIPGDNAITTGLDSTQNQLNVFIKPGIIDNDNINASAAIAQSKLAMTAASTRANATGIVQADRGLASFDSAQFTSTNGWITITDNGIATDKIAKIAATSVLGNSTGGSDNVSAVTFGTVVSTGLGVKKAQYGQFGHTYGFLRKRNDTLTTSADEDFVTVDAIDTYTGSVDTSSNGRLVIRSSTGDFGGRNVYASLGLYAGTKKSIDTTATATGGTINYYNYLGVAGLTIGGGSLNTDKVNTYVNENHIFLNANSSGNAPIVVSQITSGAFTTGGAAISGTVTGQLTVAASSGVDFYTNSATLRSGTLTTGAAGNAGSLVGYWSLGSGSVINTDLGTLRSKTLSTGSSSGTGTITGAWSLGSSSYIDASAGTLYSTTLNAGATATAGTIVGQWTLAAGSTLDTGSTTLTTTAIAGQSAKTIANFSVGALYQISTLGSTTQSQWNTVAGTSGQTYIVGSRFTCAVSGSIYGTGTATRVGTISGYWNMVSDANITWATGYLDMRAGELYADTLNTGAAGTAGAITGNWTMQGASNLTFGTGSLDVLAGTLLADTLSTGGSGTAGVITGAWTLGSGSTLVASSIASQANSATTTATTANTGGTIVLRDGSGNFSAGTITATLNGNALTSSSTTGNAATVTNGFYTTSSFYLGTTSIAVNRSSASQSLTGINIDGTAGVGTTVTTTNDTSSTTGYVTFVTATSGNNGIRVNSNMTYNASTNVLTTTATAARYADLAERYEADKEYAPGTVLVFGGDKEVTTSNVKGDTRVAGVVSTNPAYLMNEAAGSDQTHPAIALQGRVPCKVVGKINKGDILVCSAIHGVAVAGGDNIKVGSMIGKALENYDSDHIGTIEVVVGRT